MFHCLNINVICFWRKFHFFYFKYSISGWIYQGHFWYCSPFAPKPKAFRNACTEAIPCPGKRHQHMREELSRRGCFRTVSDLLSHSMTRGLCPLWPYSPGSVQSDSRCHSGKAPLALGWFLWLKQLEWKRKWNWSAAFLCHFSDQSDWASFPRGRCPCLPAPLLQLWSHDPSFTAMC